MKKSEGGCWPMVALLLLMPFTVTLRGWVISHLWMWFVVPLGVSAIGIAHACGISAIITLLTNPKSKGDSDEENGPLYEVVLSVAFSVFMPLFALAMGAICHALM